MTMKFEILMVEGGSWKEKGDISVRCHAFAYFYGIDERNLRRPQNSGFDVRDFYVNLLILIKIMLIKLKVYCRSLYQLNKNMDNRIATVNLLKF